jgi:hypothetical protein
MRITITRNTLLLVSAVLLTGVPVTSAQSEKAPVQTADVKDEAKSITVTGCVTTDADGKTFTVTGTTPTDPASATPSTWTLQSEGDFELRELAGKKVEITGTIDSKGGTTAKPSTTDSTAGTPAAAAATTGPRLHVRSVKPIADTCS